MNFFICFNTNQLLTNHVSISHIYIPPFCESHQRGYENFLNAFANNFFVLNTEFRFLGIQ